MWKEELEEIVRELLKKPEIPGHGIDHCYRVLDNANIIALGEGEPVDSDVIYASSFLHDIANAFPDENDPTYKDHADRSVKHSRKLLKQVNFPEKKIDLTLEVIRLHDDAKPWGLHRKADEREVWYIQDADNLEALGAIGIARLIAYCSKINMPFYVPDLSFEDLNSMYKSAIHDIYIHAKEIPKYLNTQTARDLAKPRIEIMEKYVERYKEEVSL